jgi:hypothetical protein
MLPQQRTADPVICMRQSIAAIHKPSTRTQPAVPYTHHIKTTHVLQVKEGTVQQTAAILLAMVISSCQCAITTTLLALHECAALAAAMHKLQRGLLLL